MPQELYFFLCKFTFVGLGIQMMLPKLSKHFLEKLFMLLQCSRINEYVVNKDDYPIIQKFMKDVIHHLHERGSSITQPEGHNQVLKGTKPSAYCCLWFISLSHPNLMKPSLEINLGENCSAFYRIEQIIHMR